MLALSALQKLDFLHQKYSGKGILATGRWRALGTLVLTLVHKKPDVKGGLICFSFTLPTCSGCETHSTKAQEKMKFQIT